MANSYSLTNKCKLFFHGTVLLGELVQFTSNRWQRWCNSQFLQKCQLQTKAVTVVIHKTEKWKTDKTPCNGVPLHWWFLLSLFIILASFKITIHINRILLMVSELMNLFKDLVSMLSKPSALDSGASKVVSSVEAYLFELLSILWKMAVFKLWFVRFWGNLALRGVSWLSLNDFDL